MNKALCLVLGALVACATDSMAQCPPRVAELIERESAQAGIPAEYPMAVAEIVTGCDAGFRRGQKVGVLGIGPGVLPPNVEQDAQWLFYPSVNVRSGVAALATLLERHKDWETVLNVYLAGHEQGDPATGRLVQRIFRRVHQYTCPVRRCVSRPALDDFEDRESPLYSRSACRPLRSNPSCARGCAIREVGTRARHPFGGCR